jgi:hypothetical protein
MNRLSVLIAKRLLWAGIPFLVLSIGTPAAAATDASNTPKPGSYCPTTEVLLIVAEELSASLDLAMHSRAALIDNDPVKAINELTLSRTALHLAASRGAAARTILLIDAIVQAKAGEDYAQMLAWFPLLRTSVQTLSDDATQTATNDLIDRAEEIMKGGKEGDPVELLNQARHMLACDSLDIPLQAAMQAQDALLQKLGQDGLDKHPSYDVLLDALRSTLLSTLEKQ